jgi:hypothetical protein
MLTLLHKLGLDDVEDFGDNSGEYLLGDSMTANDLAQGA